MYKWSESWMLTLVFLIILFAKVNLFFDWKIYNDGWRSFYSYFNVVFDHTSAYLVDRRPKLNVHDTFK